MDERSEKRIRAYLQNEEVQDRILRSIEKGRAEATVTISRAAELFNLSENRLRDWEEYGLLTPLRPTGPKGRRLYTPGELDKLAIIRELLDAGYAPGDIPPTIDILWRSINGDDEQPFLSERRSHLAGGVERDEVSINQRIDQDCSEAFWRYYVSQALRLSLALICADIPNTIACLILPFEAREPREDVQHVEDMAKLGLSLVGGSGPDHTSYTLLVAHPAFEYTTDYRLLPLTVMTEDRPQEAPQDSTYILLDRRSKRLTLGPSIVTTIRRLLEPLYEERQLVCTCFGQGMRDMLELSPDLTTIDNDEDRILNGLVEMAVRLGGQTLSGQPRWRFCCLLLPNYPTSILSLQQRSLVVRAQSRGGPFKIGITTFAPQGLALEHCVKAFQSGHNLYIPIIPADSGLAPKQREQPLRSALAVPVVGNEDVAIAVLYIASEYEHAFSEDDQRVLRMIGTMVGELLETYQLRTRSLRTLRDLIAAPAVVDPLFQDFLSENEFAEHVEQILLEVQSKDEYELKNVVSFIALDIDNHSSLANKYGDRMAREVSRAVGLRIQGQLRAFKEDAECELYHINADRYYILLNGMPLEQARAKAELLRKVLSGSYQIDPQRTPLGQPTLPENMVTLSNITVRLGISSYFYWKLKEILQRYATGDAIIQARLMLERFLDEVLDIGKREGGNVVISWDLDTRGFVRFSPPP